MFSAKKILAQTALAALALLCAAGLAGAAQLGVRMQKKPTGVTVTEVLPASPAEAAGLRVGDVLILVNGRIVNSPTEARDAIAASGAEARVVCLRGGTVLAI